MSFARYKELVEVGDTVIVFLNVSSVYAFVVRRDGVFQTKYGAIKHADLVGKRYGSTVDCGLKGRWAHVLHPTPELWTLTLPHRTQILYSTDIAVVVFQLELRPGSVVCEAGTGSGSLSHALIRAVSPTGRLYTFDFHEERVQRCREEFALHGIDHLIVSEHRDVVHEGFGLENVADAVFLDLPVPWDVVPAAKKALKRQGGRICSFSPCIEQVQRVCDALHECGFADVVTIECIQRPLDVRSITMPLMDANSSQDYCMTAVNSCCALCNAVIHPAFKKFSFVFFFLSECSKVSETSAVEEVAVDDRPEVVTASPSGVTEAARKMRTRKYPAGAETTTFVEGLPPLQTVGHTGYLTFASLYPQSEVDETEAVVSSATANIMVE